MLTDAYIAGVFDGEGSVGIYAVHTNGKRSNADGWWTARLSVVGTYRPMIEQIYKHFGLGSFTTQKRQSLQRTPIYTYGEGERFCKQGWKWYATSRGDCKIILEKILPFLIEKREQAQIALDFIDGKIEGREANKLCSLAKQFNFSKDGFIQPPRRNGAMRGSKNKLSKLTDEQVCTARREYANRLETQTSIARKYGVSQASIWRVLNNLTYKNYSNPV